MIRHPAKFWVKYLLALRAYSADQIKAMLLFRDLPGLEVEDIQAIQEEMAFPVLLQVRNKQHAASVNFVRREQIVAACHDTQEWRLALTVLEDGRLRQNVETLILSPIRAEFVVRKLQQKLGCHQLTAEAFECYQHYFWNRSSLTGPEWGALALRRKELNAEWARLALDVRGPSGVELLLWHMGLADLQRQNASARFNRSRDAAFMFLGRIEHDLPSRDHSQMFLNYAKAAALMQRAADEVEQEDTDMVSAYRAFHLKVEQIDNPSILELTEGNFSPAEGLSAGGGSEEMDY